MPSISDTTRRPWNLGRLVGSKPPLKPKHIWAIRTRLQHENRVRGCDLVRLRVADVHLGDGVRLCSSISVRMRRLRLSWVRA